MFATHLSYIFEVLSVKFYNSEWPIVERESDKGLTVYGYQATMIQEITQLGNAKTQVSLSLLKAPVMTFIKSHI